jgi:hypothetical protein
MTHLEPAKKQMHIVSPHHIPHSAAQCCYDWFSAKLQKKRQLQYVKQRREEQRSRAFKNRVLRIFGSRKGRSDKDSRKTHNETLHNLRSPPYIIMLMDKTCSVCANNKKYT